MDKVLLNIDSVVKLINSGERLFLAGSEKILKTLPKGDWIGGTIPYFIGDDGGVFSEELINVTVVPNFIDSFEIKEYNKDTISNIYLDAPENGFSLIIIPASSETHLEFALKAPQFDNFAFSPLIGWISGVDLNKLGVDTPKVFNGKTGEVITDGAVTAHIKLPDDRYATLEIINIFKQSEDGDVIEFLEDSFSVKDVKINGEVVNFYDYLIENKIDIKLPLVADLSGAMINTSFQALIEDDKRVDFYAPLFSGIKYKLASPITNYVSTFTSMIPEGHDATFSCNCILNYLYSDLEGKKTGTFTGPITFGEIAYQLLNQTMTYLEIVKG